MRISLILTSAKSIISGFMARARAIATRHCCPPNDSSRRALALSARPTVAGRLRAISSASALDFFCT